ncbi:unnamed protein product [Staurois parvus]|uniref:C2H2-type domain-containing protein n=1 Tax=Staurois parvus TaxID=386267 RepID=A0ABN9D1A4_9NEOB|nr:unnamed protein product [Staurois parvus]
MLQTSQSGEKPFFFLFLSWETFFRGSTVFPDIRELTRAKTCILALSVENIIYRNQTLLIHLILRSHTGRGHIPALSAGNVFQIRIALPETQERLHMGEKPYSCPECRKCYVRKSELVRHQKSHKGEAVSSEMFFKEVLSYQTPQKTHTTLEL